MTEHVFQKANDVHNKAELSKFMNKWGIGLALITSGIIYFLMSSVGH